MGPRAVETILLKSNTLEIVKEDFRESTEAATISIVISTRIEVGVAHFLGF